MYFLLFSLQIVSFWMTASGLTCLSCNQAPSIQQCLNTNITCLSSSEECFLDKTILSDLREVFTAGCRQTDICKLLAGLNGKRNIEEGLSRNERATISCTHCCHSQPNSQTKIPCNGYLCSQNPVIPTGAYTCAACDRTSNYKSCATLSACAPNEVCSIKALVYGTSLVYNLGCERKLICDHILKDYKASHNTGRSIASGLGKRAPLQICEACCDSQDCNKNDCKTLRSTQPCNDPSICG